MKHPKVFYGWWVVAVCSFIMLYAAGSVHFGFTAIFEPIASEFTWSYAQVSLAASLRDVGVGLCAPLVGYLVDRWGPRRIILSGCLIMGLGLVLLSTIRSLGMFYGAFLLLSIGVATTGHPVMMKAVINWFRRRVSLATGIQASGGALGGLMIILVAVLIDIFEWRMAVLLLGFSIWLVCLPLALLARHKPEQYGYLPDGDQAEMVLRDEGAAGAVHVRVDSTTRQALKQRPFWHIALALTCQIVVVSAVMTHVMPYLSSINVSRSSSALLASALPIASVAGRLGFGWLGDRVNKRQLTAVGFASLGLGLAFFGYSASGATWLLLPFLILFSTGWGGNVTMRAAMVQEYFGRERFGTIHGLMIGIITLGSMVGPPMAGWVYDRWQSYEGAWFALAAFSALAVIIMLTTPKRAAQGTAR